jgi:hypothetical protein
MIDCRAVNEGTIKDYFHILLSEVLFEKLLGKKFFKARLLHKVSLKMSGFQKYGDNCMCSSG